MAESAQHTRMVRAIVGWIQDRHGADPGLCVFQDIPEASADRKPQPVSGFVPDVFARTVPASFVIIGEAKWFRDLESRRTRSQLQAFLEYLTLQPDPQLVLATPWPLVGRARAIVRQSAWAAQAEHVDVVFLHF